MSTQARKPLANISVSESTENNENMTVEEFLTQQCQQNIADLKSHGEMLVNKLRKEFEEGSAEIKALMKSNSAGSMTTCVTLKVIAGPHLGQKFRLEAATPNGEDMFKMGRSTGRLFREKGVSLYKDKEISTTHAKIAMRNGQVFLVDVASTNGTQVNGGDDLNPHTPTLLKDEDVIALGSTELLVGISDVSDDTESTCL